ncbi:hypothetical protein QVZ41_03495 [Wenyingzhuangia sp. chi5]|uniref:Uncharacterized protein n=1 Tax=Wenyingzhuangia gilva TaxID=3057677 RepID=A0ABT8VPM9_9FLAO|nr:hypothetical protein [Wenyingzhuangia sp. chi5]MDO3693912.1 hypothetical protein [Wenyingzhuangia sp. chi5]
MFKLSKEKEVQLEKMVFLEIRNKQFLRFPDKEYYEGLSLLSDEEKNVFYRKFCDEIHEIWTFINSNKGRVHNVHSVKEYDEFVSPVNRIILRISIKYGFTLKRILPNGFKEGLKIFKGEEGACHFMDNINQS